jgi:dTDP-4-dehydrorhamnose 3,5-epimerase
MKNMQWHMTIVSSKLLMKDKMEIIKTDKDLGGALFLKGVSFNDERGWFRELSRSDELKTLGICDNFIQDNYSFSYKNVIRGMHYQLKHPQAKLVTVLKGGIMDVIIDMRIGSPIFGKPLHFVLYENICRTLYVPAGFAHGFCSWSDDTIVLYKCSDYYYHDDQYGINPMDPDLNIDWGADTLLHTISDKDRVLPDLHEVHYGNLFEFKK